MLREVGLTEEMGKFTLLHYWACVATYITKQSILS